jgi:hypothetical protein
MRHEEIELIQRRAVRRVYSALVDAQPRSWEAVSGDTRALTLDGLWHIHQNRGDLRAHTFGWKFYDKGQEYSWGAAHARYEHGETNFSTDSARRARLQEAEINGGVLWHILDEMRNLGRRWPDDRLFLTEQQQADRAKEIDAAVYRIGEVWEKSAAEVLKRRWQIGSSPNFPNYGQIVEHMKRTGRQKTRIGMEFLERVVPHAQPH